MTDTATRTFPPKPILDVLGRSLEAALNRLLALDPETQGRMAELDGRAITLDFGLPLPAMRLAMEGEQLRVGPPLDAPAALRIAATPGALLQWALARGREEALPSGRIEIAGDAALARRLEQIAQRFAPDFDEAFARVFGDVMGFQIAQRLRDALAWTRRSTAALVEDGVQYLGEDGGAGVGHAEFHGFLDAVDELHDRAGRLDARVQRLLKDYGRPAA